MRRIGVRLAPLLLPLAVACSGVPVGVDQPGPWAQVSAGDGFTCGLTTGGDAYCWGAAIFGQLGNDSNSATARPSLVLGGHTFRFIASGSDHSCGLAADGTTWCWGMNDYRELGTITSFCNPGFQFLRCARVPVQVQGAPAFDSIVVAGYTTCGLLVGGQTLCWGWNDRGQRGSGTVGSFTAVPTAVTGGLSFVSLSLDIYHACGVTAAHALFCWGSNSNGELGGTQVSPVCGATGAFVCNTSPVSSATALQVASVSAGGSFTCVQTTASETWCWGSNQDGALGNPNVLGGAVPTQVAGGHTFIRVSAGENHSCAIDGSHFAWCWGVNEFGQLGVAAVTEACPSFGTPKACHTSPGQVAVPYEFAEISAGTDHTCGLTRNGEIYCWGLGTSGELGDGTSASSSVPVRVIDP